MQGTITRSEVEAVRSKGITYSFKVAYTYSVDGQPYEGSKHRSSSWRTSEPGDAEERVARYPLGTRVPVYYQPGQPSEAMLQPGLGSSDLCLHAQTRSLSLPPFSGRKHRLDVRWRDVQSLRVEPRVRVHHRKQVTRYPLTLGLSTADGEVRQEPIADFARQEQAEAMADWLRTHLKAPN